MKKSDGSSHPMKVDFYKFDTYYIKCAHQKQNKLQATHISLRKMRAVCFEAPFIIIFGGPGPKSET